MTKRLGAGALVAICLAVVVQLVISATLVGLGVTAAIMDSRGRGGSAESVVLDDREEAFAYGVTTRDEAIDAADALVDRALTVFADEEFVPRERFISDREHSIPFFGDQPLRLALSIVVVPIPTGTGDAALRALALEFAAGDSPPAEPVGSGLHLSFTEDGDDGLPDPAAIDDALVAEWYSSANLDFVRITASAGCFI